MLLSPTEALDLAQRWESISELGGAAAPLLAVDLRSVERSFCAGSRDRQLVDAMLGAPWVNVAVVGPHLDATFAPLADAFDVLIGDSSGSDAVVDVDDVHGALEQLASRIRSSPAAAVALVQLLRLTHCVPVEQALQAESITYAMLQTGSTFQTWLAGRSSAVGSDEVEAPPVLVELSDSHLRITLNRPERRNALNVVMRDALFEALELLGADPSIGSAILTGAGANFSAGGDLDEFGTTPSPAVGHQVRTVRSLPRLMHRLSDRIRVHLHGACVGAGIELPAFADSVVATPDATFRLPEVGFGLVPGAGGTVSITRRCGRHRTAWLALTGVTIDADTALLWQLIDRIDRAAAG